VRYLKQSVEAKADVIAVVARMTWFFCLCVLSILWSSAALAQISPGQLSRFHKDLDGPAGCTKCHAVSAGAPTYRCVDCHQEIASRLQQKRGLHPVIMDANQRYQACITCHSEHNGPNFAIVRWNPSPGKFDHTKTGWPLDGKHAGAACNHCHNPEKITASERSTIKLNDISLSYLGLSRTCTSCHEDKHKGELGSNCVQCHNTTDWKNARTFDHSKAKFVLTGAHIRVTCEKCHTPVAGGVAKFVGLRFEQCSSCHNDVHRGAFQQRCESCHNTVAWKQTSVVAAKFDHSKTDYPLLGKHMDLGCSSCHHAGDFKTKIAHQFCADCHKPDPHNGQFVKRADGGKCESCHTVDGFKKQIFAVKDHNLTGFPLRGKHADVLCEKCHIPAGKATIFKVKFDACMDCHKDVHRAQFAKAPYLNRCEQCHTENSDFHATTFTLARHQKSTFTLTGAHLATACLDCHKAPDNTNTSQRLYHFDNLSCVTCHEDQHHGEFKVQMASFSNGRPTGCEACHSTKKWNDLRKFDHAHTSFELTGAHRAVQCDGCHKPPNLEVNLKNVNFKEAPKVCEECHEDPHGKQFARAAVTHCADCHNTVKWRPALFDHEKTAFSLRGAHQEVRCKACHTAVRTVGGKDVLFYKPTPTKCADCHAGKDVKVGMWHGDHLGTQIAGHSGTRT